MDDVPLQVGWIRVRRCASRMPSASCFVAHPYLTPSFPFHFDPAGCFCLSEPGSGSDAFALKTKAEKKVRYES